MDTEIVGQEAFENDLLLKALKKQVNVNFINIAKLLCENYDNKFYKSLDYSTFNAYIAQEDLGFERASVYKLMGIYRTFVIKYKVSPVRLEGIDYSKLDAIRMQVVEQPEAIEEWLSKAETLSRSDLQEEIKTKGISSPVVICEHIPITVCAKCHIQLTIE